MTALRGAPIGIAGTRQNVSYFVRGLIEITQNSRRDRLRKEHHRSIVSQSTHQHTSYTYCESTEARGNPDK
jgi:hypothetical protein